LFNNLTLASGVTFGGLLAHPDLLPDGIGEGAGYDLGTGQNKLDQMFSHFVKSL